MSDFLKPTGKVAAPPTREPLASGKPSAGITNESKGNQAPKGAPQGTPANKRRIS